MESVAKVGFWSALAAFVTAAGYGVAQIGQLAGTLVFPWDELAIFGFSLLIPVPFVLSMVALHHSVRDDARIFTHAAVALAVIYATLVVIVYPTQLAVVIPAKLAGAAPKVEPLLVTQGTFMWVVDGAGYVLMGLATLFAALALGGDPSSRWLRRFLLANALLDPVIIAIYAFPSLLLVGSLWLVTAPGSMLLLAIYFRKRRVAIPTRERAISAARETATARRRRALADT
jgi:hypothetical protein